MINLEQKYTNIKAECAKWIKVMKDHGAIVSSKGHINPSEDEITDDMCCFFETGGPIKIARIAAYWKNKQKNR